MRSTKSLIDESLTYERVVAHINALVNQLRTEMDTMDKTERNTDPSYEIMIGILTKIAKKCEEHSNAVWTVMEKGADIHKLAFEELANAIVMLSVSDYEKLVSGNRSDTAECNRDEIAAFWDNESNGLTKLDMMDVKDKIDVAAEEFSRIVKEFGEEIVEETYQARNKRKTKNTNLDGDCLTHECPMCGNKMFAYGIKKRRTGSYLIKCSGCDLSAIWNEKQYQSA